MEQTAELVAIAEGKAADADCAMVSLNEYHGNGLSNKQAPGWYIYKGNIDADMLNVFKPRSLTISVLNLKGSEIKKIKEAGFDLDGNGNPYKYLLFTKENIELEDDTVYKLAVSTGELSGEMLKYATETDIVPSEAIQSYLKELGTVDGDCIKW